MAAQIDAANSPRTTRDDRVPGQSAARRAAGPMVVNSEPRLLEAAARLSTGLLPIAVTVRRDLMTGAVVLSARGEGGELVDLVLSAKTASKLCEKLEQVTADLLDHDAESAESGSQRSAAAE